MARFVHHVHMRWMDMDAFAHVNNSAYLAYLEEARIAMFFDRYDASVRAGHGHRPARDRLPAPDRLPPGAAAAGGCGSTTFAGRRSPFTTRCSTAACWSARASTTA